MRSGDAHGCQPDRTHYCGAASLKAPSGQEFVLQFASFGMPHPPAIFALRVLVLMLLVVAVAAWWLARSILPPLEQLSKAAQAFGDGNANARANLTRTDELGKVGHAFDEMAERVETLLRAEREMLANVSHELRTPLARIRVAVELASEGDAETAKESLADVAGDLDELETLISDVLAMTRLSLEAPREHLGLPAVRKEDVSASDLLQWAASRFRTQYPGRPLTLELSEELPVLNGDAVLLRRLLDNLLQNAHRYTEDPNAPVLLRARQERGLLVEVVDHGIGMSPEDCRRVFQPFFRADRSRTRATGGLGLGLTLAQRIVEAHGGHLELDSALGRGTTARVYLPNGAQDAELPAS